MIPQFGKETARDIFRVLGLFATIFGFPSLFHVLDSGFRVSGFRGSKFQGLWFSWSGFRVTRNHFWVSQSVSCPGPVLAIPRFLIRSRSRDF